MSANGILRLGELVAERRPVEITRGDETVTLQGFVAGKRCPLQVRSEVESARRVWLAATKYGSDDFEDDAIQWQVYCRDALLAVLPGLQFEEAEILACDAEGRYAMLCYLDWWQEQPDEPEAVADPEVKGGAPATEPIGAASSRTSRPSTRLVSANS